ncbi:MAG: hypothetical protein Q9202_006669 [Teloschistes flavicans]
MIERAATCLENGGKHILRIPKKPFRKHRSLHSAFWSHGAGDIDLPAWWHAFLQVPSDGKDFWRTRDRPVALRQKASDNPALRFLDFLYPRQTLAFIHKCVSENTTTLQRRRRLQILSQRSRTYTSSADTSIDERSSQDVAAYNHSVPSALEDVASNDETGEAVLDPKAKLHELLFSEKGPETMHQLWRIYRQTQELSLTLDPGDLNAFFKKLDASQSTIDLERTRDLLDSIAPSNRRASHYACAISASLKLDDLDRAVAMHQEAAFRIQGSFGSSLVFTYAVQNLNWEAALAVWQQYWDNREVYFGPADIWDGWDGLTLTIRMRKARSAVFYAIRCVKASTFDNAAIARRFACSLVQRSLEVRRTDFECRPQQTMLRVAERMQPLSFGFYKMAIIQNFDVGKIQGSRQHNESGLELYRRLRTELNMVPDEELTNSFLRKSYLVHSLQGLYEAIEDYRKLPEGINSPKAYGILISGLVRHGDFDMSNLLLHEAIDRFGTEDLPKYARTLLLACFKRAELNRAVGIFESLREKYNYVPDRSAWHILLKTYSRVGDCDGAMALFDKLVEANIRPDSSTYAILMGIFAKRGDYDATSRLQERAISEGVGLNVQMVNHLVLAQTRSGRSDEAAETLEKALKMDLGVTKHHASYQSGDRTRMWNSLLGHYAVNGQLDKLADTTKRMQKSEVPLDAYTYAALMQGFVVKEMFGLAHRILKDVMPKAGLRATALHYSILMSGFVAVRDYQNALGLYQRMLAEGVKPTFSTQVPLMTTASKIDEREHLHKHAEGDAFEATRAEKILTQTLDNLDPGELAGLGPTKWGRSNPANVALYASYFPYLMYSYGSRRNFGKVAELYDKFIATTRERSPDLEANPPVELLSALMVSYTKAGEHEETEKCWQLAFEKSSKIACKADADTSQPGWVLYRSRYLLSLPLTRYMTSLQAMSRVDEIEPLITSLQEAGFQLSTPNWNRYIQILAQEGRALQAFELCERELMHGWPGWEALGPVRYMRRSLKRAWSPKSWEIGRGFPLYETLVYLARLYLDAQRMAYGRGKGALEEYERVAPRAVDAIVKMPMFSDKLQEAILRGE